MLKRLKRETLRERIVQEVKRHIIEGNLKPGDRLPTEMELAERLGVSRSSVREATKALEFIGVLNSSPKNGCTVGDFDMRSVVDQLRFHIESRRSDIRELLEVRRILELGAITLAAERGTRDDFDRMQESVDALTAALDAGELGLEHDVAFHREIFKAARNKVLESFSGLIEEFFIQLRQEALAADQAALTSAHEHQEICDALRVRDVRRAKQIMRQHLDSVTGLLTET